MLHARCVHACCTCCGPNCGNFRLGEYYLIKSSVLNVSSTLKQIDKWKKGASFNVALKIHTGKNELIVTADGSGIKLSVDGTTYTDGSAVAGVDLTKTKNDLKVKLSSVDIVPRFLSYLPLLLSLVPWLSSVLPTLTG